MYSKKNGTVGNSKYILYAIDLLFIEVFYDLEHDIITELGSFKAVN